jgi:hypothetical protein
VEYRGYVGAVCDGIHSTLLLLIEECQGILHVVGVLTPVLCRGWHTTIHFTLQLLVEGCKRVGARTSRLCRGWPTNALGRKRALFAQFEARALHIRHQQADIFRASQFVLTADMTPCGLYFLRCVMYDTRLH